MAAVTICSDFGDQENKTCTVSIFSPIYLPWSDRNWCHNLGFFPMLSFKPVFSLLSFTFIKRLLSSSLLSAIGVVSSAYLRLLIFLLAILIPACVSSSPVFLMMCSAYKLNKQGDNIQPWCTPFLIWSKSIPCLVLTYFLTCIQVSQESGKVVWYSHLLKNFSVCCAPYSQRHQRSQWSRSRCFSKIL